MMNAFISIIKTLFSSITALCVVDTFIHLFREEKVMNVNNRHEVNGMNDRWRHKLRALDMMIRAEKNILANLVVSWKEVMSKMSMTLSEGQIDDLLDNVLDTRNPNYWKSGEKLICCPVHG